MLCLLMKLLQQFLTFELTVVLEFDAVAAYVVNVLDSLVVVVAFHLAVHLDVDAMLNHLGGIEAHVDVVLLVLPTIDLSNYQQ